MELAFTDGFNQSVSLPAMNRQCTNWYPKFIEDGVANGEPVIRKRLFGTPGQSQLATTGSATSEANRGAKELGQFPYFVNGTSLHRLNADFTTTSLGTVAGSGKVSMAENGIQLMILVPNGNGYIFNKDTAVFTQITDSDFFANGQPQIVIFVDGFFMVITDTKKVIISNLNDGLAWSPLDFGTAESDPDRIVSLVNFRNQVYILGSETIEAQDNIGGADFPFIRNGLFLDKGIFARFSVVKTSATFMFIGGSENEDPRIWSLQGNGLVSVSNTGVNLLLAALTQIQLDEVAAYAYSQDGSTFVSWELPGETIVYDVDNGKWHKRQSQITDDASNINTLGWRTTALIRGHGKLIGFDTQDGRIGDISLDFFDEYGTEIQRTFDVNPIRAEKRTFVLPRIELTIEAGVGNSIDPKIRMKTSRDGKTFRAERIRSMGKAGEFDVRQVWRQNGRFKQYALLRFLLSEKVRPVVIRVDAEIGVGR